MNSSTVSDVMRENLDLDVFKRTVKEYISRAEDTEKISNLGHNIILLRTRNFTTIVLPIKINPNIVKMELKEIGRSDYVTQSMKNDESYGLGLGLMALLDYAENPEIGVNVAYNKSYIKFKLNKQAIIRRDMSECKEPKSEGIGIELKMNEVSYDEFRRKFVSNFNTNIKSYVIE